MSETNNKTPDGKKVSVSTVVAAVAVVGVLVLGSALAYTVTRKEPVQETETPSGSRGTVITEENVDEIVQSMNEPVTDATYTVSMTNVWTFADGTAEAEDFYVGNPKSNKRTVYFDLFLSDTGELIYSSPYIPVGEEMDTITLDKDLDAGNYEVVMTYHLVDDDHVELTTVSVAVEIHILN